MVICLAVEQSTTGTEKAAPHHLVGVAQNGPLSGRCGQHLSHWLVKCLVLLAWGVETTCIHLSVQRSYQPAVGRDSHQGLATSGDMATVAHLLGHASIDCLQRCVDVDQRTLQVMFADGT